MITSESKDIIPALQPGSGKVLIMLDNQTGREDVKSSSSKHFIKSSFSFETVIDADLNILSLEDYRSEKVLAVRQPYIKLRYSGENFIKSYPKQGRDYTERKIISRTREFFFWNNDELRLIPCDKKLVSLMASLMVKNYIAAHNALPSTLTERKKFKNGQVQYALTTKQGLILIKLTGAQIPAAKAI